MSPYLNLLNNVSKNLQQTTKADGTFRLIFCWRVKGKNASTEIQLDSM